MYYVILLTPIIMLWVASLNKPIKKKNIVL